MKSPSNRPNGPLLRRPTFRPTCSNDAGIEGAKYYFSSSEGVERSRKGTGGAKKLTDQQVALREQFFRSGKDRWEFLAHVFMGGAGLAMMILSLCASLNFYSKLDGVAKNLNPAPSALAVGPSLDGRNILATNRTVIHGLPIPFIRACETCGQSNAPAHNLSGSRNTPG